mgnify:CR=1 FL=1
MNTQLLQANARHASRLLKAMSNHHRLLILCQLLEEECCVGELVRRVGLSQSALSQHLARLRRDHLVTTRRSAQTIYYNLASDEIRMLIETLNKLYRASTSETSGRGVRVGAAAA